MQPTEKVLNYRILNTSTVHQTILNDIYHISVHGSHHLLFGSKKSISLLSRALSYIQQCYEIKRLKEYVLNDRSEFEYIVQSSMCETSFATIYQQFSILNLTIIVDNKQLISSNCPQ